MYNGGGSFYGGGVRAGFLNSAQEFQRTLW